MPYTKEDFEQDEINDRELEMLQDSYDELAEMEHRRKLQTDLDYLYSQDWIREFIEALETLKERAAFYDLDLDDITEGI